MADAPDHAGDAALWSGNESATSTRARSPQVTVPTDNPTLTFDEITTPSEGYDYAYTVISTDGGKTYTALANDEHGRRPARSGAQR